MTRNVLFIHSAGDQSGTEGSGPLVAALRPASPPTCGSLPRSCLSRTHPMPLHGKRRSASTFANSKRRSCWSVTRWAVGDPQISHGSRNSGGARRRRLDRHTLLGNVGLEQAEWALPRGFEARFAGLPRIALYHSRDDDIAPVSHVDRYAEALPKALVRKVDGRGHLFADGNVADILADIAAAFAG